MTAFKVIQPKKLISGDSFTSEFVVAANKMAAAVNADFAASTSTWAKKPDFSQEVQVEEGQIKVMVLTSDQIFRYVSEGTVPHIIRPVKAKMLHWVNESGEDIFAKEVNHPGFAGRKIVEAIVKKWEDEAVNLFENAMNLAVQKTGHAL